jgi:hypothetical protein
MNDELFDGWYMYFYTYCWNNLRWSNQLLVEENKRLIIGTKMLLFFLFIQCKDNVHSHVYSFWVRLLVTCISNEHDCNSVRVGDCRILDLYSTQCAVHIQGMDSALWSALQARIKTWYFVVQLTETLGNELANGHPVMGFYAWSPAITWFILRSVS